MRKSIARISIITVILGVQIIYVEAEGQMSGMEWNTNRMGSDYKNFDLPAADPKLCQDACATDPKCKAWTYVKPNTIQGPRPRCWLKYQAPSPRPGACCVSGVKEGIGPTPGVCAEFVGVTRQRDLGNRANVTDNPNWVRRPYRSPRGWNGDVIIRWTKPPMRICSGESFAFSIEVENLITHPEDPGGSAAYIGFAPVGGAIMKMSCTNPAPWDPISSLKIMAPQPGGMNRCTAVVKVVGGALSAKGGALFITSLTAGPFIGAISYNYRKVP